MNVGSRLRSVVCTTEVIVVRAPTNEVSVECGGIPMVPHGGSDIEPVDPIPTLMSGTELGKRYESDKWNIEVLCTKAGEGTLSVAGELLLLKTVKPLPSSD
jgi:hypothetical protein